VVVLYTSGTMVGMVMPNGLEARQRVREYMPIHSCVENVARAVYMATSSARMMVFRVSAHGYGTYCTIFAWFKGDGFNKMVLNLFCSFSHVF